MTEHNTRSKTATDRLEVAVLRLTQNQTSLTENQTTLSHKIDAILEQLNTLSTVKTSHSPTLPPPPPPPLFRNRPLMKLEVPRFDGEYSMGWIFKISQFFEYQKTPEEERIIVASFYMDGPALSWYQWMFCNGLITSWQGLFQALEIRFAPSFYDDPKGALFKLTQKGSVNEYLTDFERLAN